MLTFKQLEAVWWVAKLGNFALAADKLHTSQSAISKRIRELEADLGLQLFDRQQRTARLTPKGQELATMAQRLLDHRTAALDELRNPVPAPPHLRIGVTELTALTWLAHWVHQIHACHPQLNLEPDIDNSTRLLHKLQAGALDVILVPDAYDARHLQRKVIGKVDNAWMGRPGLLPRQRRYRLGDLANHRLILQDAQSGTGLYYDALMAQTVHHAQAPIVASNLFATIGFTLSGLGVSYLPRLCLAPMVAAGQLEELPISPKLPAVTYVALYKRDQRNTLVSSVVVMAQSCCDFSTMFQSPRP